MNCPLCGGPAVELGSLGPLLWYRCRSCGLDFSFANVDQQIVHGDPLEATAPDPKDAEDEG